jgi:CheY-like chemotaxis protein
MRPDATRPFGVLGRSSPAPAVSRLRRQAGSFPANVTASGSVFHSIIISQLMILNALTFIATEAQRLLLPSLRKKGGSSTMVNRLTVLFADPESSWHSQAAALLQPHGVNTVQVRTGREALSRIEGGEIHLAVLDQNMPQLSGLQVVKLSRDFHSPPPAILLARDLTNHFMQEALGMKVFSVLGKPVDLNVLLDTLARAIKRHYAGKWPG